MDGGAPGEGPHHQRLTTYQPYDRILASKMSLWLSRHQVKQRGFYGCSRDQCLEEIDRTDEVSIYEIKPVTIHLIPWVHMMRRIFAYQGKHHIRGHFSQFHRGRKLLCLHHVRRVLLDVDFIYFICKV
ncbi:hypothetical protein VPH35_091089 [Triticum aestivum]